ncbi:MAG: hypothetical protein SAJ12_10505 [Jaaginema sp. PMC 1079.18]|nr:hypothetical protein [Jaaginema sp. PMC 1080.18]MEC4851432.1 hypothetical protein [Jaaginema sp. PMC 1079.18]MEC4866098.1 hypothetical protein [Jaaginema sp. PMC 1078.18]
MPYFQDEYGYWEELGTITPNTQDWLKYPYSTELNQTLFRFTFVGDISKVESFCWVRLVVRSQGEPIVLPAQRYYCKSRPFGLDSLTIPKYLILKSPRWIQEVEIRKSVSRGLWRYGITNDMNYQIKAEVTGT